MKKDKLNRKDFIVLGVIGIFALVAVFSYSAKANEGSFVDRLLSLISRDYVASDKMPTIEKGELTDTFGAMPGNELYSDHFCVDEVCHYFYAGSFNNATSTLFAIKTPNNATSTLVDFTVNVTGVATTSMQLMLGTSTLSSIPTTGAMSISESLLSATLATSTLGFFSPVNDAAIPIGGTAAGGLWTSIQLAPADYLVGYASSTSEDTEAAGWTGLANTFTGTWTLEFTVPK